MVSGLTDAVLEKLMTEESCRGEALSRELGVTRAAVCKQIEKLRADRRLWEDMAQGCRACGAADAVKVICDTILEDFRK